MKQKINDIRDTYIYMMGNPSFSLDIREKAMNIVKFIDTYMVSVDILRKYNPEYYTSDDLANILRFIKNYDNDIQYLYANNESIVRYVKTKGVK